MPIGIQRLNARRSQPNPLIVFIKPLPGPTSSTAQDFLERIAAQCVPVMRAHHINVMTLEEYEPNREFVGRNFNAGEVIQLVLRSRGGGAGRWLPFAYVQMVMMHELAHCKQMNHSRAFWAVRNGYADEMRALWARGYTGDGVWGRGAELGSGMAVWERSVAGPEDALPEHLCGGTFRSRGGRRTGKRRAREELSYRERKERRILKKFGPNGVVLGAEEETRVELERGVKVKGKPRVAASARGRNLRAAAALARFEKSKEEDVKEGKVKKAEEGVSEEWDTEYEEDGAEDVDAVDAVDIDGSKMLDGKGRGLLRVCSDAGEDADSKDDVQRELLELQAAYKPSGPQRGPGRVSDGNSSQPRVKAEVKEEEEEDYGRRDTLDAIPFKEPQVRGRHHLASTRAPPPHTASAKDATRPDPTPSTSPTTPETKHQRRQQTCGLCSFSNPPLAVTCAMCANVLDPTGMPGSWRCSAAPCRESGYVNGGDSGVCGLCAMRRVKLEGGG